LECLRLQIADQVGTIRNRIIHLACLQAAAQVGTVCVSTIHGHFSTLDNLKLVMKQDIPAAGATHYDIIRNGAMFNDWKAGLSEASAPASRVTWP
jgi:hypothetical protein